MEVGLTGERMLEQALVFCGGEEVRHPHVAGGEQSAICWRRPAGPRSKPPLGDTAQIRGQMTRTLTVCANRAAHERVVHEVEELRRDAVASDRSPQSVTAVGATRAAIRNIVADS